MQVKKNTEVQVETESAQAFEARPWCMCVCARVCMCVYFVRSAAGSQGGCWAHLGSQSAPSNQKLWERGLRASDGERKNEGQVARTKEGPEKT